ncbi:aminotransferase class V-fold PLP-dependent enzyme [bacterium]|nr:aminotransferase class V-fold PLP-dependent enzyme [bacterium]MDC0278676.1 aminotransferase class V-fold PLP-dependent enzyme [bacterium]
MSQQCTSYKHYWQLNPNYIFLNHGCFGAVPKVVAEHQSVLRTALEKDPIRYLTPERELESKLDAVRNTLAGRVGAQPNNLVFVRNATDGVNAVLRSFPFKEGDEVVITNHGYNACNNAVRYAAERFGARVRLATIPFPISDPSQVIESVEANMSNRTRLILVDHASSPTGLLFPIQQLIELAHQNGSRIMIDGAHAAGMQHLEIEKWGPDYYTANHHKWWCAPKVSGFLYVRPELQPEVQPTSISHPYNTPRPGRSAFLASFDWTGTYDPTPILSLPAAFEFFDSLRDGGINASMQENHRLALLAQDMLCSELHVDIPAPSSMIGSMVTLPFDSLENQAAEFVRAKLFEDYQIEVPLYAGLKNERGDFVSPPLIRISLQAYNDPDEIRSLADALKQLGVSNR